LPAGGLKLHIAELAPSAIDGFREQENDGTHTYMWSRTEAKVDFQVQPGEYRLTLRVAKRTDWSRLQLILDDRELPAMRRTVGRREVTYQLEPTDFAAGNHHELMLRYRGSRYPRLWGSPCDRGVALIDVTLGPQEPDAKGRTAA